eukprot:6856372-Prymnesium_polylepis.2
MASLCANWRAAYNPRPETGEILMWNHTSQPVPPPRLSNSTTPPPPSPCRCRHRAGSLSSDTSGFL